MLEQYGRFAFIKSLIVLAVVLMLGSVSDSRAGTAGGARPNGSCTSSSPCLEEDNLGKGPGVQGTSAKGNGLAGTTTVYSSGRVSGSGIEGDDLGSGAFNSGVFGTSLNGTGVVATSKNGTAVSGKGPIALAGTTTQGSQSGATGVVGYKGIGLFGAGNTGIDAIATIIGSHDLEDIRVVGHGGRLLRANNSQGADVFTLDDSGNVTVGSASVPGTLSLSAKAYIGTPPTISGGTVGAEPSVGALAYDYIYASASGEFGDAIIANGYGGLLFRGNNSQGFDVFIVDDGGNVHAHSFTADLLRVRQPVSSGAAVLTYAAQATQPNVVEDGRGALQEGGAFVPIDSRLASAIDGNAAYYVFLTPEGDSPGLYVASKTRVGFMVRECGGGRSNIPFTYRIVAKPYKSSALRLERLTQRVGRTNLGQRRMP